MGEGDPRDGPRVLRRPRGAVTVLLLVLTVVLAGCGERAAGPRVTESQAYDRIEGMVRSAVDALPAARLEPSAPAESTRCEGQAEGRVVVSNSYWLRDIDYDDRYFDTMLRWWTEHGFEVVDDLRPERHYLWVEKTADGFRMSLRANENGELLLGAESPCLDAG